MEMLNIVLHYMPFLIINFNNIMGLRLSLIYELGQNALIRTTGDCYPAVDSILIKNYDKKFKLEIVIKKSYMHYL